jgi:hypothetical protein
VTRSRRRALAVLLLVAAACATTPSHNALWADLERGQFGVGYRSASAVHTWYPAASGGEPMRFGDYAAPGADARVTDLRDRSMLARRDATAVAKTFPAAIIITKDGEGAADYAPVAEYLASHGYVISVAGPKAKLEAHKSAIFLHNIGVTAWTLASQPESARANAEKLLAFLTSQSTR